MRKLIIAIVCLTGFTPSAFSYYATSAERCSTVDLRQEFSLKMRNQGDISWCYAHASADYLQYHFKLNQQISAADIAIQYNLRPWPRLMRWLSGNTVPQTGFIRSAMYDIAASGYCTEEAFPSEAWVKKDSKGSSPVQLEQAIEDLFLLQEQIHNRIFLNAVELPYSYAFKNVSKEMLFDILYRTSPKAMLNELRLTACEKSRTPFAASVGAIGMRLKGKNAFNRINAIFDLKSPLTVDFFYGVLDDADHFKKDLGKLHTTIMMGRRFSASSQECQYLIKNSYGTDCSEYDPRHTCEAGYVWMNESDLYRAMTSYVYIKNSRLDDSGADLVQPMPLPGQQQIQGDLDDESSEGVPASTSSSELI